MVLDFLRFLSSPRCVQRKFIKIKSLQKYGYDTCGCMTGTADLGFLLSVGSKNLLNADYLIKFDSAKEPVLRLYAILNLIVEYTSGVVVFQVAEDYINNDEEVDMNINYWTAGLWREIGDLSRNILNIMGEEMEIPKKNMHDMLLAGGCFLLDDDFVA